MITALISLIFMIVGGSGYLILFLGTILFTMLFSMGGKEKRVSSEVVKKEPKIDTTLFRYHIVDMKDKLKVLRYTDDYFEAQELKKELRESGKFVMIRRLKDEEYKGDCGMLDW